MQRYKRKISAPLSTGRRWYGLSLLLHLLLFATLGLQPLAPPPPLQGERLRVTLKTAPSSSPVPQKARRMNPAKIAHQARQAPPRSVREAVKPAVPVSRRPARLAESQPRRQPSSSRTDRQDRLAQLLEISPELSRISASTPQAEARLATPDIPRREARLLAGGPPAGEGRRSFDLSARLTLDMPVADGGEVRQTGRDLELALIADSRYTILPEFRWGAPEIRYPLWARQRGSEGSVALIIDIRESGDVGLVRCAETPLDPDLADFLIQEASHWKFKPVYRDGEPLSGIVAVRVHYTLRAAEAPTTTAQNL